MLQAVIFDVDGTLAETEEFHRQAFNDAFAAHGLAVRWSVEQYRLLLRVTGGKERLAAYFRGAVDGAAAPADGPQPPPGEAATAWIAALHATKNRLYAERLAGGTVSLRPGVARLLDEAAAAGITPAIATTTSDPNLDALLTPLLGAAWRRGFGAIVAGDQVARKKPAPDVYLECLRRLGLAATDAVAIEDSQGGVRAARAAGIAVLATPSLYCANDDLSGAQAQVPDLGDPVAPWPSPQPGFPRRWVEFNDLERLRARSAATQPREETRRGDKTC